MKKYLSLVAVMIGLITVSCSQDEPATSITEAANSQIKFAVTADNGSRSATAYQHGLDVTKFTVSSWVIKKSVDDDGKEYYGCPNYAETNEGNCTYFLNDVLKRGEGSGSGSFNYASDARYWPANGEVLDFFAVIDNEYFGANGEFVFNAEDAVPGLAGMIEQKSIDEMPDMLYACSFDEKRPTDVNVAQKNVSLDFNHAFAKVIVTAQVKNSNIRVYITDMKIVGVAKEGRFFFPHKVDQDSKVTIADASWKVGNDFTEIACPLNETLVLDMAESDGSVQSGYLVGGPAAAGSKTNNDLLVIPNTYGGRDSSKFQTYIQLMGYAYNISNKENGFNPASDILIYPQGGKPEPAIMNIPVEFTWEMGTVNRYNIVFDCGNGGSTGTDPNTPALIRIGYEVEVTDWKTGETQDPVEYKK